MQSLRFRSWTFEFDPEATRDAYRAIAGGSPDLCGCRDCRNFAAVRRAVYPAEALKLYATLGIDPAKEAEVYHYRELEERVHLYGGWHHFVGRVVGNSDGFVPVNDRFALRPARRIDLVGEPFRGKPLVQLEFDAHVFWEPEDPAST